jgi:hypothetical protein
VQSSRIWRSGRGAQLKLLGALRGQGALLWSGRSISATYELDVFARGSVRAVSGHVEGDFSTLVDDDPDAERSHGSRLRLADGREIEIELVSVESAAAEFDACSPSAGAALLATRGDRPDSNPPLQPGAAEL